MNPPNSSLSQFIEEYPLYVKFATDQPVEPADLNNLSFNFYCQQENEVQPFRLSTAVRAPSENSGALRPIHVALSEGVDFIEIFAGNCQSCQKYKVSIIVSGTSQKQTPRYFIRKIGQYPAPECAPAKLPYELLNILDPESCEFYRKAIKALELGHGMGSLTYLTQIMKREIGRIIETLSNLYFAGGNKIADSFMAYNECGQKMKFIDEVTPQLPDPLKEHGANILLVLNDAAALNIQELTEKYCVKKAKDIDTLFRYLARKMLTGINETPFKKSDKYFLRYS